MIRSDGGGEDIGEGEEGVWFDFFDRGFGCRERKRMWRKKVCGRAWQCLINIRGACIRNGPIGDCTEIPPGPMMVLVVQILLGLWPKLFLSFSFFLFAFGGNLFNFCLFKGPTLLLYSDQMYLSWGYISLQISSTSNQQTIITHLKF
jgi:hypothetical protein